jgi:hypothetical protein
MPRYYFNLRDGTGSLADPYGTDLADDGTAGNHARAVARELMRHCELQRRHWLLEVYNEHGKPLFAVPFASVDCTLDHVAPQRRHLIEQTSERRRILAEVISDCRQTLQKSRAIQARARGKPYLIAERGRRI